MDERLDIEKALLVAENAARVGGQIVREQFGRTTHITMKRGVEEQIPVDTESERAIIRVLDEHFPHYNIHGEELGTRDGDSSYTWIIDPLDGTSNFILGIPQIAVCVSLMRENEVLLTVIYQPILNIVYTAALEYGAYLNQERIYVRKNTPPLAKCTICRVLSYGMHNHKLARQVMNTLYGRTRRLLDTWAPSLDWCMLASGKADGLVYVSTHLLRLDPGMVAGLFLFQEAGGYLGNLEDGHTIDNVAQVESVIAATSLPLLKDIWRTIDHGS